mgnify:CR=1 FL=1
MQTVAALYSNSFLLGQHHNPLSLQLDLHGAEDADALLTLIGDRPVTLLIMDTLVQSFDGFIREAWPEMIGWLIAHIQKLEAAFSDPLSLMNRQVRAQQEAN